MAAEHIEQQRCTDLKLTGAFARSRESPVHQACDLGDGAEASPLQLGKIQCVLQIPLQLLAIEQQIDVVFQQLRHGVALRCQQLKAVVVHRHRDRAPLQTGEPRRPEEADALMHEPPFKGVGKQMCAFPGATGLNQQLPHRRQHRDVLLPIKQGLQSLKFSVVEITTAGAVHLKTQVMSQQIGESHLPPSPGRHRARFLGAHLHVGGHVAQPHEFQLAAGEEEHILRLQLADEGLLHMAEHSTTHKAHGDRRCGRDRSNVETVQPGDGFLANPVALACLLPLELAVAGVGTEALSALLQKQHAPVPILLAQLGVGRTAAHGLQGLFRVEARAAGQPREVLQQHIQRGFRRLALFHQPLRQSPTHSTEFEQLERIGGHEQHLGCSAGQVR